MTAVGVALADAARLRRQGRAIIAQHGVAPIQRQPYEDPERGWVVPVDDPEVQHLAFEALTALWALLDTDGDPTCLCPPVPLPDGVDPTPHTLTELEMT